MSRFRTILAGAAVAVVAVALPALPAHAHDSLIGSDPASGSALDAAPEQIVLEFSGNLMTLGDSSAAVVVSDSEGRDWAESAPVVEGREATIALADGMPADDYEVAWQVVSEDGHPISGVVTFTVEGAPQPTEDEPATDAETDAPTEEPATQDDVVEEDSDNDEGGVGWALPLILGAVVLVTLAVILIRRRKTA